jgi:hypothetical protein
MYEMNGYVTKDMAKMSHQFHTDPEAFWKKLESDENESSAQTEEKSESAPDNQNSKDEGIINRK